MPNALVCNDVSISMLPTLEQAEAGVSTYKLGWSPVNFLTKHASQIAVANELPILMFILLLRS